MEAVLRQSRLFVLVSEWEGVYLCADAESQLAAAVVPVVTGVGTNRRTGFATVRTGVIVPVGDAGALADSGWVAS